MQKPMREVSKSTSKAGGDGPPSNLKNKKGEKAGHKQTGGAKSTAEGDLRQQTMQSRQLTNADPFRQLMAQSSRNARYSLPLENMGVVDAGDPANVTEDENLNMPKTRRKS